MTFDQIKTFLWVARLGGFRRAAERLNLSQPAVSTRVANSLPPFAVIARSKSGGLE